MENNDLISKEEVQEESNQELEKNDFDSWESGTTDVEKIETNNQVSKDINFNKISIILSIIGVAVTIISPIASIIFSFIPIIGQLILMLLNVATYGLPVTALVFGIISVVKKQGKSGLIVAISIIVAEIVLSILFMVGAFLISIIVGLIVGLTS